MAWILLASLAAAAAAAAEPPNESLYTVLKLDDCVVIERVEEGDSVRWRCPGHDAIPVLVSSGDGRFDLDAGVDNGTWESMAEFNQPGPVVEWRMRGGAPIAVIFRLLSADTAPRARSVLIVETIGREGHPGCRIATIATSLFNANAVARDRADRLAAGFRCGVDRPEGADVS